MVEAGNGLDLKGFVETVEKLSTLSVPIRISIRRERSYFA
jgi:hypothetical protein